MARLVRSGPSESAVWLSSFEFETRAEDGRHLGRMMDEAGSQTTADQRQIAVEKDDTLPVPDKRWCRRNGGQNLHHCGGAGLVTGQADSALSKLPLLLLLSDSPKPFLSSDRIEVGNGPRFPESCCTAMKNTHRHSTILPNCLLIE